MSVARNSVLAFLPHVVGVAAGLASSIVTARYLGASGRGVLGLTLMTLGVLLLVSDAGISASITYLVSAGRLDRRQALRLCLGAAAGLGALAWLVAAALWPVMSGNALGGVSVAQYAAALAALPAMLFVAFWIRLSMALGEFTPPLRLHASLSIGSLALAVLTLPIARQGVFEFLAALAVMHWTAAAVTAAGAIRRHGAPRPLPAGILRAAFSYGSRAYLGALVSYATLRVDAFVLNAYSNSASVGRYDLAMTFAEKLWLIDSSIGQAALPEVVARESDRAADLVASANRAVVALTVTAGGLLFAIAPFLVNLLYGAEFHASAAAIRILVPGVVAYASGRTLLHYHQGHLARPGTVSIVMGISALIAVTLYFILIPRYGITGAAAASSIAYASVFVMAATLFVRETGLSLRETFVPGPRDVAALTERFGRSKRQKAEE